MKLISAILIFTAISLSGCTSLNVPRPTVENAALLDVVTTGMGLAQGGRELNPLGFTGTNLAKLYYLYVLRPEYTVEQRAHTDRLFTALFTGAAVNNIIQTIWAPSLLVSAAFGAVVGWSTYNAPEVAE
jgi:hypothetical protein